MKCLALIKFPAEAHKLIMHATLSVGDEVLMGADSLPGSYQQPKGINVSLHLKDGDRVRRGQVLGYVGTSGNAPKNTPHLHFAVYRLSADKRWWEGTPIDPYDILR